MRGKNVLAFLALWSLILCFHCNKTEARNGDLNSVVSYENNDNLPIFDWDPLDTGDRWASTNSLGVERSPVVKLQENDFPFLKKKRAVLGIFGLATKRPHKTAAEINHLPPQDSFLMVRGKKMSASLPLQKRYSSFLMPDYYPRMR